MRVGRLVTVTESRPDDGDMEREVRRSAARYQTLAEASSLAVWRTDEHGELITDMPGWRDLTGQKPDELAGFGWLDAVPGSERARVAAAWTEAVRTGEVYDVEYPLVTESGAQRRIHARGLPVREGGRIVEWIGTATDITERHEALVELQAEKLAVETLRDIGVTLSAELELDRLVAALTDATTTLTGAQFGAFFYTVRTRDGGEFLLHSLSGISQEEFGSFPAPRNTEIFAPTFEGKPPVRIDDVTADARFGRNPPYHGLPEGHLPVRSYLAVPVVSRSGQVHGGLFFGHAEAGRFTERHERLVVGIASQAAIALDNAALYEAERTARAEAELARHHLEMLAAASHRMSTSLEVAGTATELARACLPELGDSAAVFLVGPGRGIESVAVEHVDPAKGELLRELLERYPVRYEAPYGSGAAIRTGEPSFEPEVDDELRQRFAVDDEHFALSSRIAPTSVISVPLAARGRVIGALAVRREGGATYTTADLAVVEELAQRGAVAIDNAQLYARERSAALMLQRSLLPRLLPSLEAATCATRYIPGAAGAEVGGDWYDVLALDGGAVAVAIGDVQGRGLVAASVMGQLRAAVRAYALEDHEPREVIVRADRVVSSLDDGPLATCSYGRYDPVAGTLVIANAGHLPPLLVDGAGARFLEVEPGLPLGVGGAEFAQTEVAVADGSLLVLYTDGLVEDAATPLDVGMARLADVAAATAGLGVDEAADRILDEMVPGGSHDDDVAVLVLGIGAVATDHTVDLSDDPYAVRTARRVAGDVAVAVGDEALGLTVCLLVSEVVTNAIRHVGAAGRLRVRASGRRIRIEVFDRGEDVLEPRAAAGAEGPTERRRGLQLVDTMADAWGVEPTTGGKCVWFEITAAPASVTPPPSPEVPDGHSA